MLYNYFFACLVLIFTGNAASGISLDYYYGYEDTLRSSKYFENCNSQTIGESCHERCGGNYACLLGKCFCVKVTSQIKDADHVSKINRVDDQCEKLLSKLRVLDDKLDKARTQEVDTKESTNDKYNSGECKSENNNLLDEILGKIRANNVDGTAPRYTSKELYSAERNLLGEFLGRATTKDEVLRKGSGDSDSSEESSLEESNPQLMRLEEHPAVRRHHVAHFCPNLDVARKCVRKCLNLNRPAFCGKDHVCYCGLKYGTPEDKTLSDRDARGQFADLYEKYFGPRILQVSGTPSSDTPSSNEPSSETASKGSSEGSSESQNEGKEDLDESEKATDQMVQLVGS